MGEHEREECQPIDAPAASGADKTRRKLTLTGLGAPILMTLVSKPALAGNCLSNMMSGNLSDPNREQCQSGWSPGGWGNNVGEVADHSTEAAWLMAGYNFHMTLLSELPSLLVVDVFPVGLEAHRVLNPPYANTTTRTYVTAWLNAKLSEVDLYFTYVLTPDQVLGLIDGTIELPPSYNDPKEFFHSTWD